MHSLSISPYFASIIRTKNKRNTLLPSKKHRNPQIRAMRAVVQRVASASVEVDGRIVSEIGPGLLVLVGLHDSDTESDADYICRKVLNMRLFPNESTGKGWDQSGNKPDFHVAMPPQKAKPFYESLLDKFRKAYQPDAIKDGVFGAVMKVSLVNDGPVTMQLDSSQPSNDGQTSYLQYATLQKPETKCSFSGPPMKLLK
ncbi:D-aminoacyl-tRNA deacylase DTD - like 1 [Theobroma cacao]|nr:D-aminoacyl-tRNA deacylase DTD - like 1 [Theobroma cacao]